SACWQFGQLPRRQSAFGLKNSVASEQADRLHCSATLDARRYGAQRGEVGENRFPGFPRLVFGAIERSRAWPAGHSKPVSPDIDPLAGRSDANRTPALAPTLPSLRQLRG